MEKINFKNKYPVYTYKLQKNETTFKNINNILEYFEEKIKNHPVSTYISTFDNYSHTKSINGNINDEIINAKIIIFCFGKEIPVHEILAVRPRSFGVCEFDNFFTIDFMEAPSEQLTDVMVGWAKSLKNI